MLRVLCVYTSCVCAFVHEIRFIRLSVRAYRVDSYVLAQEVGNSALHLHLQGYLKTIGLRNRQAVRAYTERILYPPPNKPPTGAVVLAVPTSVQLRPRMTVIAA